MSKSIDDMNTGRRVHVASRRSALAMLGLVPATAAFALEHTIEQDDKLQIRPGTDCQKIPEALRALADSIESNETLVERLGVVSDVGANDVVSHELSVKFAYKI